MNKIIQGDCLQKLKELADESVDCVITSPPYWALRDYGVAGQLGLELTFQEYINNLCNIFDEVKRVLKKTGTCWVNIGDSYAGSGKGPEGGANKGREHKTKPFISKECQAKSLIQIPSRFSIEMTNRGWILRNEIIWHKPNVMPVSCTDRFTVDFEKVFFFVKNKKYNFNQIKEPCAQVSIDHAKYGWKSEKANAISGIDVEKMGSRFVSPTGRNKRTVWKIPTSSSRYKHIAMFPEALIKPMIEAGCLKGGIVLDPFAGAFTSCVVAKKLGRSFIGIELNPDYIKIGEERLASTPEPLLYK